MVLTTTAIQGAYVALLRSPAARLVVVTGRAGTGKTHFAVAEAVNALARGETQRLVFTRPTVTAASEALGFLPGNAEEKLDPFVRPMLDALGCFMTARDIQELRRDGRLEMAPLAFMRGRTFTNTWLILDESQNATMAQMKMALTRAGHNTKTVVTGDLEQSDLEGANGLADLLERLALGRHDPHLIGHVELGDADVKRSEVVREVLRLYGSDRRGYGLGIYTDSDGHR